MDPRKEIDHHIELAQVALEEAAETNSINRMLAAMVHLMRALERLASLLKEK